MADLYDVLGVSPSAADSEIKQAYKRRSLETHPDRHPVGSREQEEATTKFQDVNNAYYVLSDTGRRREYDSKRSSKSGGGGAYESPPPQESDTRANQQFQATFEEMMAGETRGGSSWCGIFALAGGAAGAILGFIIANIPGALIAALVGCRLGMIRDARGKAVMEVFQELPHAEKAKVLSGLMAKVMGQVS